VALFGLVIGEGTHDGIVQQSAAISTDDFRQCTISNGRFAEAISSLVTPPSTVSRSRL
jgi:hypothetical protein